MMPSSSSDAEGLSGAGPSSSSDGQGASTAAAGPSSDGQGASTAAAGPSSDGQGASSEIELTVKSVGAESCQLRVSRDMSVMDFKRAVSPQMNVPVDRQRLIYRGRVLKDDHKLSDYGIDDGMVLHLVVRPEGSVANAANDEPPAPEAPRPSLGAPTGMLMGTVTIPEGQGLDLAAVMNSMLGGLGLAARSPAPAQAGRNGGGSGAAEGDGGAAEGDGEELPAWAHVRQCEHLLEALALSPMRAMGVPLQDGGVPPSAAADQLSELLHATDAILLQTHVYVARLAAALRHEGGAPPRPSSRPEARALRHPRPAPLS